MSRFGCGGRVTVNPGGDGNVNGPTPPTVATSITTYADTTGLLLGTCSFKATTQLIAPASVVGAPAYTFAGDLSSGIFNPGLGIVAITLGGQAYYTFGNNTLSAPGVGIALKAGTQAVPSILLGSSGAQGFYSPAADQLAISLDNTTTATFSLAQAGFSTPISAISSDVYIADVGIYGATTNGLKQYAANTVSLMTNAAESLRASPTSVLLPQGTTIYPGISFLSNGGSGLAGNILGEVQVVADSTLVATATNATMAMSVPLGITSGSIGSQTGGIYFNAESGTGICSPGDGSVQIFGSSTSIITCGPSYVTFGRPAAILDGTLAAASLQIGNSNSAGTGFYRSGTEAIGVASDGTAVAEFSETKVNFDVPVLIPNGTLAASSLQIGSSNSAGTGFYRSGTESIGVASNGNAVAEFSGANINFDVPVRIPDGTVAAPSFLLASQTQTGFCKTPFNLNSISFVANGAEVARFSSSFTTIFNYGLLTLQAYIGVSTNPQNVVPGFSNFVYVTNPEFVAPSVLNLPNSSTVDDGYLVHVLSTSVFGAAIYPYTGDQISIGPTLGAASQGFQSLALGSTLTLFLYGTIWYSLNYNGAWTPI